MSRDEQFMTYVSRVRQLGSHVEASDVSISDKEVSLTVICSPNCMLENSIVDINTVADDDKLTTILVKIQLIQ